MCSDVKIKLRLTSIVMRKPREQIRENGFNIIPELKTNGSI